MPRRSIVNMARRLLTRQIKQLKLERKLATSAKRHEEYVIKSSIPDVQVSRMRVLDRLWIEAKHFNNKVAIECAETKKCYTYEELRVNMARFATCLLKLGLCPGDVVAAMLPNSPEFPVVALGSLQAGCTVTTINPIYKEYEVTHQISRTEPKVVVTLAECYDVVVTSLKNSKLNSKIIIVDNPSESVPNGAIRFSEIAENGEPNYKALDSIERGLDDIAFIPFSSGTTGLPKGVEITYDNLLASLDVMQQKETCYTFLAQGSFQDVVPCILPFFHIYGMVVTLLGHLSKGCKLITLPKFTANQYIDILKNDKSTLLYLVPPVAILLGKHPDVTKEHFKHVRHIVSGAAPLSATDVDAILDKCDTDLVFKQGYGATETCSLATSTFIGAKNVDYSACGTPMVNMEIKFVDPLDGTAVPVGQAGEIYVKGPTVMRGYFKNEEATKDSLTEDGYFKTGDLGFFKPRTGLFVTDRIKELIKVKGMQVAPAELESLLRSHPSVQDAAVIGVPHDFYGEVPKAFIIPKKGVQISPEELQRFVAAKVAAFKKIQGVEFVKDIPKTSSGKILRKDLKKMYSMAV